MWMSTRLVPVTHLCSFSISQRVRLKPHLGLCAEGREQIDRWRERGREAVSSYLRGALYEHHYISLAG